MKWHDEGRDGDGVGCATYGAIAFAAIVVMVIVQFVFANCVGVVR